MSEASDDGSDNGDEPLLETVEGNVKHVATTKQDASLVIQILLNYGSQSQRDTVDRELQGRFPDLIQPCHSHDLILNLIGRCPSVRSQISSEFHDHSYRLLYRGATGIVSPALTDEKLKTVMEGRGRCEERQDYEHFEEQFDENEWSAIRHAPSPVGVHPRRIPPSTPEEQAKKEKRNVRKLPRTTYLLKWHIRKTVAQLYENSLLGDLQRIPKAFKSHKLETICLDDQAQLVCSHALMPSSDTKTLISSVVNRRYLNSLQNSSSRPPPPTLPQTTYHPADVP
ncbi:hypothetical protein M407DRAFT_28683 [Tulasnella calospora MUT 4182]|uniref:Uncharacterized protein n=1 Tax=Tulasnella calospora MUT 4182 TaxID=1051891 RepID=A0A0C3LK72_9AGAM|nr:hypothetical protein M407DRAFT_28683 [Tulasnella calospora MUT 4182]